jgi:hypothetical protein
MCRLFLPLTLTLALQACALQYVSKASDGQLSTDALTVVTGRVNYVIDGEQKTPYGALRPAWPAPPMMALSLATGDPHVFGPVAEADGGFRWAVAPGAYVVSSIGTGSYTDDTRINWPRLVLCVPRAPGATVYVGHLWLEGTRYAEDVSLSTGTRYTSRGVRYAFKVIDESTAAPGQLKRLMRHVPDMPIGDRLQQRWKADAPALERELCGAVVRQGGVNTP